MSTEERFADAVVVAAGSSRRMDGIDKLGQDLGGRTVLQRSVDALAGGRSVRNVVLVVAPDRLKAMAAEPWITERGTRVVAGGERRQDSVAAGVRAANAPVVLVHDGARPLVSSALVDAVADAARLHGAAIPVIAMPDSLKRVEAGQIVGGVSRDGVFAAQTPQGARRDVLLAALESLASGPDTYTDEAELLARYGVVVASVPGETANLKVTVPADLDVARSLVRGMNAGTSAASVRVGLGTDVHPFGPDSGLRLGGLEIPLAPRLYGHSDGDVVLHALCDALLGAAGLPDLGRAFPASDPATRGIDSATLVTSVLAQVIEHGWRPQSVDVTILGARPKLGGRRLDAMAESIAHLLEIAPGQIAVKASTGNLSGDEGAGRVIRATVTATLTTR
jgi:2-C-methyl-D-erythritol 4-phosphate cytidylyltransferase / 2-C-methyl-D-erythritol 2,4-cyclodiphosphate synthase